MCDVAPASAVRFQGAGRMSLDPGGSSPRRRALPGASVSPGIRRTHERPSSSSPPHRRHATRQRIRRPAHRAGGDGSLRAPADGASLHVAAGPGVVPEMEQDRIVWDAGLAKPPGSGGSPGKTHCYQGLRVKVTGDQIVDRQPGSTLPLPTVTARCAERLSVKPKVSSLAPSA